MGLISWTVKGLFWPSMNVNDKNIAPVNREWGGKRERERASVHKIRERERRILYYP